MIFKTPPLGRENIRPDLRFSAFVPEGEAVEATATLVACMETELYGVKIIADPSEPSFYWQDSS